MKANKGFTLIELLAVIVILAIIALIATPMVLNVIDTAKEGSAKASAYYYVKAVENKIAMTMLNDPNYAVPTEYTDVDSVKLKGTKPTSANLTLEEGVITAGNVVINGYTFTFTDGEITSTSK